VEVLKDIRRRFDGTFALNAWTAQPGTVSVGDRVEPTVLEPSAIASPESGRFA